MRAFLSGSGACVGAFVGFGRVCAFRGEWEVYYARFDEIYQTTDSAKPCVVNCYVGDVVGGRRVSGAGEIALVLEHE